MVIVAPLYWVFIFNKKRKAKPIIKSNTVTGKPGNKDAPLLSAGEIDDSQPSNGYSYSGLGQPCNNSAEPWGVANLPSAYKPQPCDQTAGLQCVQGIYEGSICLSQIGFFCDSVNDCVPEADACFNNICSKQGDTINQRCISDGDCQVLIDYNEANTQPKIYNHICQKEKGKKFGYCKVNLYPYDNGCNSNSECAEGVECVNQRGNFNITITISNNVSSFKFKDNINWGNLNDLVAQVFDSTGKSKGTYQIYDFETSTNSGKLQPTSTTKTGNLSDGNYTISLGQANKGICLKKITKGGPANLSLGGVSIPCEDGTTNIKNFCLTTNSPSIGDVCVNGIVNCPSLKVNDYTIQPECLYNDATEQGILNDYYFGLSSGAFAEYKLGNCTVPSVGKEQLCDNLWNGCSGPYICIQETSQNGNPVSICNVPFQAQICFNGKCPENYICGNPDGAPPLCLGKKEAFCIENGDCKSDQCSSYSIKVFDPVSSKIINTFPINLPAMANDNIKLNLYHPEISATTFPQSNKLIVPTIKLFWFKAASGNYGVTIIDKNNTTKTIHISVPTSYEIKDIIMDEDENFLMLYKRPVTNTMRQRSFPIGSISTNEFELPDYNGLINGIKVYYVNTGSGANMAPTNQIYTLNKLGNSPFSNFALKNKEGNEVTLNSSISYNKQHFIVTYDNKYAVQTNLEISASKPYPLLPSYDFTNKPITEQLKNGDLLYYHKVGADNILRGDVLITPPNIPTSPPDQRAHIMKENSPYYITPIGTDLGGSNGNIDNWVFSTGVTPSNNINYIITQGYYHSVGGYPIIDNYKAINQYIPNGNYGNYFSLNSKGFYTYGITTFNPDDYTDGDVTDFTSQDDFDYIYDQNKKTYDINGINQGITYLYNSLDDNIKINSKKINNKNYLIINKGLCYSPEYDNSRYINQFIQLEYNVNRDSNINSDSYTGNNFENTLITTLGTSRSIFSFNIVKNIAQNQSKGFYYRDIKNGENNIDYVNINNNDSLFYTLGNNNSLNNKSENSLAINSKYEEFSYKRQNTGTDPYVPVTEYNDFNKFNDLKPLDFSNLVNISERKANENYFIEEQSYIYIYDETDINNILNFSSSELVLTKEAKEEQLKTKKELLSSAKSAALAESIFQNVYVNNAPQITWDLINIVEYEVNMETEYLKIKIHARIDKYDNIKDIIEANTKWQLHVYNFVKLNYYYINFNDVLNKNSIDFVENYVYTLQDASLLFNGSKGNEFYKDTYIGSTNDNKYGLYRTGYNNIMIETAGKNSDHTYNTLPTAGNAYSIYTINDGAGVKLTQPEGLTSWYADEKSYHYSDTCGFEFYEMNANVSYYNYNPANYPLLSSPPSVIEHSAEYVNNIRPDRMPYQYYIVNRDLSYPYLTSPGRILATNYYPNTPCIPTGPFSQMHATRYTAIDNNSGVDLDNTNSLSNGRFFPCFMPFTNKQIEVLTTANNSINETTGVLEMIQQIPLPETIIIKGGCPNSAFTNASTNIGVNDFSQCYISTPDSITMPDRFGKGNFKITRKYTGHISLPYSKYSKNMYAVNQLFASSLPLGDTFFINSSPIKKDFIIPTVAYDKDGKVIIKNLGNIPLYQTHMAHYQTGTNKNADYFNQTNQVAISFPKWLKARYVSRANEIPKIRKVIIDSNDGNNYANATYYAFIEYGGNTSLVYLDAENTNFDLAQNQGIPTSKSIFKDGSKINEVIEGFTMSGADKLLYILSKSCN